MRKIAIITIYDPTNYGNRLQNYALSQILSHYASVETLVIFSENWLKVAWKQIKEMVVIKAGYDLTKTGPKKVNKNSRARVRNFKKFNNLIKKRFIIYKSPEKIKKILKKYDFCIVGSDQVWNPSFWNYEDPNKLFAKFFLKDVEPSKRVAVAASFGGNKIPKEWEGRFANELKKFHNISVRENGAKKIIKELTGKECSLLVDPTLVLNKREWDQVINMSTLNLSASQYILKYFLGEVDKQREEYITKISEKYGLFIHSLNDKRDSECYKAGPCEFLYLFEHASLIVTDSFHAIVFAIILEKPFVVFNRIDKTGDMSDRIITILSLFGFRERIYSKDGDGDVLFCDFSDTNKVIAEKKEEFIAFIEDEVLKLNKS